MKHLDQWLAPAYAGLATGVGWTLADWGHWWVLMTPIIAAAAATSTYFYGRTNYHRGRADEIYARMDPETRRFADRIWPGLNRPW